MNVFRSRRLGLTVQADDGIRFPYSPTLTACHPQPHTFAYDRGTSNDLEVQARIAQAKAACRRCPIATTCLQWALAHPELTPEGIWAATTARERTGLRQRLTARLGTDWVGVVAHRRAGSATTPGQPAHSTREPEPTR
ncbi:WhiB family transcriptional regulator [Streptomyces sp. NPDC004227]